MKRITFWLFFGVMALEGLTAAQQASAAGGKMASTAIVVLTHEFCTSKVRTGNSVLGYDVFRPGRLLCPSAEEAVRNSFERVIRMETVPKPEDSGGHLVLVPKFADMEATKALVGKRNMTLLLEWSAIDPGGKIVWVQTVEGDARKKGASHEKIGEELMRDLVAKSTEAITGSQEVRRYIETHPGK
jgi:hypothetical protein